MSITLEEAIVYAEEIASRFDTFVSTHEKSMGLDFIKKTKICAAEHRQLVDWLLELQERRKHPEIIHCKDCVKREYCRTSTVWAVVPGDDWYCADAEKKGEPMFDFETEKKQCFDEYENGTLIMSDDKCGDCEHKYECRFMKEAMDEVVYGTD